MGHLTWLLTIFLELLHHLTFVPVTESADDHDACNVETGTGRKKIEEFAVAK